MSMTSHSNSHSNFVTDFVTRLQDCSEPIVTMVTIWTTFKGKPSLILPAEFQARNMIFNRLKSSYMSGFKHLLGLTMIFLSMTGNI